MRLKTKTKYLKPIKWKYVTAQEFCDLLGVQKNVWYSYLRKGKVQYCGITKDQVNLIDYVEMFNTIRSYATNANYYNDSVIVNRRVRKELIPSAMADEELKLRRAMIKEGKVLSVKSTNHRETEEYKNENENENEKEFTNNMNRREAETIKQVYLAKQAKVKFLKETGALTDTKLFMDQSLKVATMVQKAIMAIPHRVQTIYASMTDADAIGKNLEKELILALSKLKFDFESIKNQSKLTSRNSNGNGKDFLDIYDES